MRGLIHLAVLVAIGYFGYTQLWPRYRSHQQSKVDVEVSAEQAHRCVSVAESVNSGFAAEMLRFARPPVDTGMWATFMVQTSGQLSSADSACRCPEEACVSAAAALLEQRKLLQHFDAMVRGTSTGIANPATSIERINSLLARARAEAG